MAAPQNFKQLLYDLAAHFWVDDKYFQTDTCVHMFTAALIHNSSKMEATRVIKCD
jgi:hypothetical protein